VPEHRRVDFLIGGVQKGGTTALHAYLRQHPGIFMPDMKELHFFDKDGRFARGFETYHRLFSVAPPEAVWGEASPSYVYYFGVPKRVWGYHTNMKWIVLLREPISRAYSHWNMMRERKKEPLSFGEAIRTEDQLRRAALPQRFRTRAYVDRGFYLEQLRRLWRFFPPDQTLVLKSEDLRRQPDEVLSRVWQFLGVSPLAEIKPLTAHARSYVEPLDPADRDYLRELYEFSIRDLERALGWDCSDWRS
jgi:hypothetical protein